MAKVVRFFNCKWVLAMRRNDIVVGQGYDSAVEKLSNLFNPSEITLSSHEDVRRLPVIIYVICQSLSPAVANPPYLIQDSGPTIPQVVFEGMYTLHQRIKACFDVRIAVVSLATLSRADLGRSQCC